jgi:type IV fimbrial biogenesis protein FimT
MSAINRTSHRQRGVTMLEVVMGVAVAATLSTAAVPSLTALASRQQVAATTNELVTTLNLARSEAIARSTRVVIATHSGDDWSTGWRVFVDANDNGIMDAGETVVREFRADSPRLTIRPQFGLNNPGTALSFDPTGRILRPGSHGMVLGRLTLKQESEVRSVCFASLRFRVVNAATCS